MKSAVYAIATLDTKGAELEFVVQRLRDAGISVKSVDVGTGKPPTYTPDVSREEVLGGPASVLDEDRGNAVTAMSEALCRFLKQESDAGHVQGVIGIGGSGGTSIVTAAMRRLPIGMPKMMVSTMASGNTAPYVDCSDISMMYSVVDVAGLNVVSEKILSNAAHAIAGMVAHRFESQDNPSVLGMTMFGVTTPCVTAVRESLEGKGFECLVFHATGTGGRAMEQLVDSGMIRGVLDITTTEVADEVVGGVLAAGHLRFEKLIEHRVPLVMSTGALDMVNFGALETVPEKFKKRKLHKHNSQVTLMRTNVEENREIARWIAGKINESTAPLTFLIPEKGVSMIDAPGQPFYDPAADAALFSELESAIHPTEQRQVIRLPLHINDPEFAEALVEHFQLLLNGQSQCTE